jgi:hypothetical protein
MRVLLYILLFVLALGFVAAYPAVVTGTITDSDSNAVEGADVEVNCNGNILTDVSKADGTYYVVFDSTDCGYLDSLLIKAEKGGASGSTQENMCDTEQCDFALEITDDDNDGGSADVTIPEFGVIASFVALIGAICIVAYGKKN